MLVLTNSTYICISSLSIVVEEYRKGWAQAIVKCLPGFKVIRGWERLWV